MRTLKKTIALVTIAATAVGGYQGYKAYNKSAESTLLMQNVEALSGEEGSSDSWDCWSSLKAGSGVWRCGVPCEFEEYKSPYLGPGKCYK